MTDRLSLTNALADANIDRQKAERIATEIYDAIHDNVATKADLERVEAALKADIAAVRADLSHRIDTMVVRLVTAVVVALGVLFAALQHWPPH